MRVRGATALGGNFPLALRVDVLKTASPRMGSAAAFRGDLALVLRIHVLKAASAGVRCAAAFGGDFPLAFGIHVLKAASPGVRCPPALGRNLPLPLGIHASETAATTAARPLSPLFSLASVGSRMLGVEVGALVVAGLTVPSRLRVVVRGAVVVESRSLAVRRPSPAAPFLGRFFGVPFVGAPALVGGPTARARDAPLLFGIHSCKAASVIGCHC
jgi:hypothetical protein